MELYGRLFPRELAVTKYPSPRSRLKNPVGFEIEGPNWREIGAFYLTRIQTSRYAKASLIPTAHLCGSMLAFSIRDFIDSSTLT